MKSLLLSSCVGLALPAMALAEMAAGVVFHDQNGNEQRDAGEPGVPDVTVSNGIDVAKTDADGNWELPARKECVYFLNKPEGWMTPVDEVQLPEFYYVHKPEGSPEGLEYPGVSPTGDLPESIDFPLYPQQEGQKFEAIFFGDTQSRDQKELDYMARDVVAELIGRDSAFGVTLGDVLFDDLAMFGNHNALVALIGVPWYNVLGNHDINFDVSNDALSDETWERIYGPNYYAYEWGPVSFFVLDNVKYRGKGAGYGAEFGEEQLKFVENMLPHIAEDRLIMFMMHIPIMGTDDRDAFFRLVDNRPYTMSISGHTHFQSHHFLTEEDGWRGKEPHHHLVNVTVCGSWWSGEPDDHGIPTSPMRDGAPNGYSLITFENENVVVDFKAARRPADYQLRVEAPNAVKASDAADQVIYANVFAGSERSTVEMRVGGEGAWMPMEHTQEEDPWFKKLRAANAEIPDNAREGLELKGRPVLSSHLWKANLPAGLEPGVHHLDIRTEDMWGRTFHGSHVIRITD